MRLWIKGKTEAAEPVEKDVEVSLRKSVDGVTVLVGELGSGNAVPLLDIHDGYIYLRCCEEWELRRLGFRTKGNGEVAQK